MQAIVLLCEVLCDDHEVWLNLRAVGYAVSCALGLSPNQPFHTKLNLDDGQGSCIAAWELCLAEVARRVFSILDARQHTPCCGLFRRSQLQSLWRKATLKGIEGLSCKWRRLKPAKNWGNTGGRLWPFIVRDSATLWLRLCHNVADTAIRDCRGSARTIGRTERTNWDNTEDKLEGWTGQDGARLWRCHNAQRGCEGAVRGSARDW